MPHWLSPENGSIFNLYAGLTSTIDLIFFLDDGGSTAALVCCDVSEDSGQSISWVKAEFWSTHGTVVLITEQTEEHVGKTFNLKVRLKDTGLNLNDAAELIITVADIPEVNNPPYVANPPASPVFKVGEQFSYTLTTTSGSTPILKDADSDRVTSTLKGLASFMDLKIMANGDYVISGIADTGDDGAYTLELVYSDTIHDPKTLLITIIVQGCALHCATCLSDLSKCTSCESGFVLFEQSCLSSCPQGYALLSGSCVYCDITAEIGNFNRNLSIALTFKEKVKLTGNASETFSVILLTGSQSPNDISWTVKEEQEYSHDLWFVIDPK